MLFLSAGSGTAQAANKIVARIDISDQRMEVLVDGRPTFEWKVSTAGKGYVTPTGSFKPTRMEEMWYSRKYDNSPMPHSVFFKGGYAVHATNALKRLGTPASHGCIRLHPRRRRRLLPAGPGLRAVEHQHRDHRVVRLASRTLRHLPCGHPASLGKAVPSGTVFSRDRASRE